jgi:hypothetical protein
MNNSTPIKDSDLLTSAQDLVHGETLIGNDVDVAQNKAVKVQAEIDDLIAKRGGYEIAKEQLATYREAIRSVYSEGRGFMALGRDVFKPRLGNEFSDSWKLVGFEDSLTLPSNPAQMQLALKTIKNYLTANPTYEVAPLNVTAAQAQTLFDQMSAARGAVYNQEMVVSAAKDVRDVASDKLRTRYRGFIDELSQLLGPMDPRWRVFGLNVPDAPATPDVVEGLKATLIGPTAVALKWEAAARANYYRVFKKIHGSEDAYEAVGSPADLDFTIENLPPNTVIDIVVTALNAGGESQYSQLVTINTHA